MSTKLTISQLNALGIEVVMEAPAKEIVTTAPEAATPEGTHRNAAGRLVDANGRFVADPSKKPASSKPASKKGKKGKPAPKPAADDATVVKLQKSTRPLFVAAHPALKSLSTKQIAVKVVQGFALEPGFVVGDGYRKFAAEQIANA